MKDFETVRGPFIDSFAIEAVRVNISIYYNC